MHFFAGYAGYPAENLNKQKTKILAALGKRKREQATIFSFAGYPAKVPAKKMPGTRKKVNRPNKHCSGIKSAPKTTATIFFFAGYPARKLPYHFLAGYPKKMRVSHQNKSIIFE